uniref:Uncharacterized protein n=1 Tax=Timema bartmani TaxID=61472 RepID=A0A7R9F5M2_9NEOP|nr:unnamed protein product [Timema bartmani]
MVRFRMSYNGFYEQVFLVLPKKKRTTLLTEHDLREGEMILPSVHYEGKCWRTSYTLYTLAYYTLELQHNNQTSKRKFPIRLVTNIILPGTRGCVRPRPPPTATDTAPSDVTCP